MNLAETEKGLYKDDDEEALFQALFLAARAGSLKDKKAIETNKKIDRYVINFIEFIIAFKMLSKQIWALIGTVVVIGMVLGIFVFKKENPVKKTEITVVTPTATPTPTQVALATWTDEAGFTFQYPEGTTIDKHPEDNKNYADLTLTFPNQNSLSVIMSDNSFKNLDGWVAQRSAIDTTLEGRPAKKIIENGITTIACIDNEVLVTISGQDVSQVVDSWKFVYPTPVAVKNTGSSVSSGDVLEEF